MPAPTTTAASVQSSERLCAVCKTTDGTLQVCQRCDAVYYCGKTCQTADWKVHKILCRAFAETPRPSPSHRRIIYYHPKQHRPEVLWVNKDHDWAPDLLYLGGDPSHPRRCSDLSNFFPLAPLRFDAISQDGHRPDFHLELIARGYDRRHSNPNDIILARGNPNVLATMIAAGLLPGCTFSHSPIILTRWTGNDEWDEVMLPTGPKLEDITMADFSCCLAWLAQPNIAQPSSIRGNDETKLESMSRYRISVSAWDMEVRFLFGAHYPGLESNIRELDLIRTEMREARLRYLASRGSTEA